MYSHKDFIGDFPPQKLLSIRNQQHRRGVGDTTRGTIDWLKIIQKLSESAAAGSPLERADAALGGMPKVKPASSAFTLGYKTLRIASTFFLAQQEK